MGIRLAHLSWRQVIFSALLAGMVMIIATGLIPSLYLISPWGMEALGIQTIGFILLFLTAISAGAFLLPVFDPQVRKPGPAPSVWKVATVTCFLTVLMVVASEFVYPLLVAILFAALLCLGVAIALILVLANKTQAGAWLGAVSILMPFLVLIMTLFGFNFRF